MRQTLTIVKIGGNVVDSPEKLSSFLSDFRSICGSKLLVHGGGKIATSVASSLGVETKFIDGRRVTSPEMMDVATMVYAGLINKKIVAELNAGNCSAVGLSGADAMSIVSHKRPAEPIDFGMVGDVESVNGEFIAGLIDLGITPVFCAVTADCNGNLLNTNADTIAEELAISLAELFDVRLIFCFEKEGVLDDDGENARVIPFITNESFNELKASGIVNGGMIPKITNALRASKTPGIMDVIIKGSDNLLKASGTTISYE